MLLNKTNLSNFPAIKDIISLLEHRFTCIFIVNECIDDLMMLLCEVVGYCPSFASKKFHRIVHDDWFQISKFLIIDLFVFQYLLIKVVSTFRIFYVHVL